LNNTAQFINVTQKVCLFSPFTWLKGLLPIIIAEDNHLKNKVALLLSDRGGSGVIILLLYQVGISITTNKKMNRYTMTIIPTHQSTSRVLRNHIECLG
jgi:hypothetical protein